jgi:pilus assembly protein Flp/PilA
VRRILDLAHDQKGSTLVEYGLILALIFVVMMVGLRTFATQAIGTLNHVRTAVVNAGHS